MGNSLEGSKERWGPNESCYVIALFGNPMESEKSHEQMAIFHSRKLLSAPSDLSFTNSL